MSSARMNWDDIVILANDENMRIKRSYGDSGLKRIPSLSELKKVEMIRKSEYMDILKKRREAFVMELFSKDMEDLSRMLKESAEKMQSCNHSHLFPVADWLDLPKMEKILQEYFRDLGYTVVSQIEEKENKKTVKIMLS